MRVCIVVGARPQFIKAAELIRGGGQEDVVFEIAHTGQHYDPGMSGIFFDELEIPTPAVNLGVGSGSHGFQTGEIMKRLEVWLLESARPNWIVVFGDTNSTIAATLAAAKLGIPIAHVEAGLRSFDHAMPEEVNRIVCDRLSTLLFCPSENSVLNLAREGIRDGVFLTGDVMFDSVVRYRSEINRRGKEISAKAAGDRWAVATVHRASNIDDDAELRRVLACLEVVGMPVVWPVHPRAKARLESLGLATPENVSMVSPVGYLDMLAYVESASMVLTDSGGIQKEAFWLRTPCITLRETTEWPETVELGWNVLAGTNPDSLRAAIGRTKPGAEANPYGTGDAAQQMISHLILYDDRK